jgi:hypothetical protein
MPNFKMLLQTQLLHPVLPPDLSAAFPEETTDRQFRTRMPGAWAFGAVCYEYLSVGTEIFDHDGTGGWI